MVDNALYGIKDYTIIISALYAKNQTFITYDELDNYRTILYQEIIKRRKYIMWDDSDEDIKVYDKFTIVRTPDGIYTTNFIDEETINESLIGYPEDIVKAFKSSRDKLVENKVKLLFPNRS